jgi:bleomycin hydrolase
VYNNQPIDILVEVTAKSINAGEPVWFGCEVRKNMASEHGILDITAHDYQMVFNTNVNINLSKADRLKFGDSSMTHAMVFTGFNVKNYEEPQDEKMNTGEGDMVTQKGKQGDDVEMESNEGNGNSKDEWKKEFEGNITKWRVETSWGDDKNEQGYPMMTQQWFREYVFEVVVDKKFCSQEILNAFDLEPRVLPAWDPMGSLAKDLKA